MASIDKVKLYEQNDMLQEEEELENNSNENNNINTQNKELKELDTLLGLSLENQDMKTTVTPKNRELLAIIIYSSDAYGLEEDVNMPRK